MRQPLLTPPPGQRKSYAREDGPRRASHERGWTGADNGSSLGIARCG